MDGRAVAVGILGVRVDVAAGQAHQALRLDRPGEHRLPVRERDDRVLGAVQEERRAPCGGDRFVRLEGMLKDPADRHEGVLLGGPGEHGREAALGDQRRLLDVAGQRHGRSGAERPAVDHDVRRGDAGAAQVLVGGARGRVHALLAGRAADVAEPRVFDRQHVEAELTQLIVAAHVRARADRGRVAVQEEDPVPGAVAAAGGRRRPAHRTDPPGLRRQPARAGDHDPLGRQTDAGGIQAAVRRRPEHQVDLIGVEIGDDAGVAEQREACDVACESHGTSPTGRPAHEQR